MQNNFGFLVQDPDTIVELEEDQDTITLYLDNAGPTILIMQGDTTPLLSLHHKLWVAATLRTMERIVLWTGIHDPLPRKFTKTATGKRKEGEPGWNA